MTDIQASKAFYADTLGLMVSDEGSDYLYLRALEERGHHCMVLKMGAAPKVNVLGFKVFSEKDLDQAHDYFSAKNLPVSWVERPFQGRTLLTRDPQGIPLEFYFVMDRLEPVHQKYALYKGVKPLRIDHFNVFSTNVDESVAFYNDMGFRTTEYTEAVSYTHLTLPTIYSV